MNKPTDKLLKEFEVATARVATLESELSDAKQYRDFLRKELRAILEGNEIEAPDSEFKKRLEATKVIPMSVLEAQKILREYNKTMTASDLSKLLGCDDVSARNRLQRGTQLGLFERVGRGLYKLAVNSDKEGENEIDTKKTA